MCLSVVFVFREMKLCIPNAQAINRGAYRMDELVEAAKKADFTDIVVVNETRGNPDNLIVSHLPFGPTAYFTISNCILRHDIPECAPSSLQYPHLVIDGLSSKVGRRIGRILQALYPGPATKPDSRRIITYANNNNDFISFRHHTYTKDNSQGTGNPASITLKECGPRFELQPYEIRLGTMDQNDTAEKEWVLRPYMNTSRKQSTL
jgi:U3 small nucleolar ribonucleoprotein protein IMP4